MQKYRNVMGPCQETLELLLRSSLSLGADRADALWVDQSQLSLACRQSRLEGLERSEHRAITLRCCVGNGQAIVSSTDMSPASIQNLAASAVLMAKSAPPDPWLRFAPPECYASSAPNLDLCDPDAPSAENLFAQAQETEMAALSVAGITNSEGAEASCSRNHIGLMIANGNQISYAQDYHSSYHSLSVSVLAGSGTDMQRDYAQSTARHRADVKTPNLIGEEAAQRALRRMHPRKMGSAVLPVLYDRRVSKQLLSAFASAINGSNIVRGSSFLRDALGTQLFGPQIQILDDPIKFRGLASKPFDGEGVACQPLTVVDQGRLCSWILDMRSAAALGMRTTGHASRGMGTPPAPAATNFTLLPGHDTPEALLRQMGTGLWITESFGTGINITTGDYSQGVSGFLVEGGEIVTPVAEITVAGHLRDMFARMIPASDLYDEYATNAPSVLIEGMAIAGAGSAE